ncbi:hypothetical protein [Leptospira kirschneri]|uniref:hypothetical protein n=1 Tax=Leptospira kirschneri TaxID=29507 RepID=UPI000302194F|nr:hypothetical protein [Leptospira kirschneri]
MDRVLGRSTDFGQTLRFNLLSWKNSIIRKAFQKNEKNADSKKRKQNVCFSKSQSNNLLKCSIN